MNYVRFKKIFFIIIFSDGYFCIKNPWKNINKQMVYSNLAFDKIKSKKHITKSFKSPLRKYLILLVVYLKYSYFIRHGCKI